MVRQLLNDADIEKRLRGKPGFDKGQEQRDEVILIGKTLRDLRKRAGLSQKDAARLVGMDQPDLSRLENGVGKRGPTLRTYTRIVSAYESYFRKIGSILHVELNLRITADDSEEIKQNLLTAG